MTAPPVNTYLDIIAATGVVWTGILGWLNYRRINRVHKDVLNHVDKKQEGSNGNTTSLRCNTLFHRASA